MNGMAPVRPALERFSAGEISRIELGHLIGKPVSFGEMLMMLHAEHLPLPRYGRHFNPAAIEVVKKLAVRNGRKQSDP